jgi:hypothetical protein
MAPKQDCRSKRFSRAKIQLALGEWWDEHTNASLRRPRERRQVRLNGGTVFDIQPAVSAAQVIEALGRVEPLLGFTPGIHVLRRDGYNCKKQFVDDLSRCLKAEFNERIRLLGPPLERG